MSKTQIPSLLKYPDLLDYKHPEGAGLYCYAFPYGGSQQSCLIYRNDGNIYVKTGDWSGVEYVDNEMLKSVNMLSMTMKLAGIPQAQFYFQDYKLFDIRISLNKLASYSMIRELFGKNIPLVDHVFDLRLDDVGLKQLSGKSKLIIKPNVFRYSDKLKQPLYFKC